MSLAPTEIAVTTDSVLVEQEPSRETRRRLRERKTGPDGLDSKDAEGGAALGDPTSMRSWLSCLDIVCKTVQYVRFPGGPPPEYWTRPWLLSFGDRTGSGVSNQV